MVDYPITQNVGLGSDGKFTGGDPSTGQSASRLSAAWMNAITDELLNVVRAAGLNPDEMNSAQLLAAIRKLVWSPDQIPELDAAKITSGAIDLERLPALPASIISSGLFDNFLIPQITWDHYPVGAWLYWPKAIPPTEKWAIADGRLISRTEYPDFVAFAESNDQPAEYLVHLRAENGNETKGYIYVPNLTEFVRGITTDVGRFEADAFQGHAHYIDNPSNAYGSGTPLYSSKSRTNHTQNKFKTGAIISDGLNGSPRYSKETRPKNRGMLPIIKIA